MYHVAATTYSVYHAVKRGVDKKGRVYEDAYLKAKSIDHATGEDIQRRFNERQITGRLIFVPEDSTPL